MARPAGIKGKQTRQRILSNSLKLFARSGYAAVSMREIAEAVGVGPGALYNHFATKQHILMAIMEEHMRALLAAYAENTTPANDAKNDTATARLEAFVRFHISYHIALPDAVFLSYMELRNLTPENHGRIAALRTRYEDGLDRILHAGTASGAMQLDDPRLARMALIAMLNGVNTWFREGGRLSLAEVQELYWDMVRKSVAA